jgi:hypothetical protein
MGKVCLSFFLCFLILNSSAQQKVLTASKAVHVPKIDGNLDDAAWDSAAVATGFVQFFPKPYAIPDTRTVVRILYDDEAIYVSAYLYDDPSLIRRQLTARDGEQQTDVDYFSIFFDTYNDLQNGFQFLVTSANVQTDARLGGNSNAGFGNYGDKSWDAVWQSQTSIKADGWVVEMRIPYISLRFAEKEVQTWGLQMLRYVRRNSESDFWNPIDPNLNGFVNQFGKLHELRDIQPPLRLSFSPYVSTGVRSTPNSSGRNTEFLRNGGMDVKYGINESFTLDATIIPDFGQVISDNVVNNLSPFEIQFQENRPFFTEGTELFNKAGLFYSRRVGATPQDYSRVRTFVDENPQYRLQKNPTVTQLYNAIKLSGRTQKKLGIGVFNAVTAPMRAELIKFPGETDTLIQTEPLANYNIIVLDQAFKGRSFVTLTNTNVLRSGIYRDANVTSVDFAAFDKSNTYSLRGTARYSKIFGNTPYSFIQSTPYSFTSNIDTFSQNGRLFVKPYDGFSSTLRLGKVSGQIQYFGSVSVESDGYDANDLGYLQAPNEVNYTAGFSYNQYEPKGKFFNYSYNFQVHYNWLYNPYRYSYTEFTFNGFWLFRNMWDIRLTAGTRPTSTNDYFELRTKGVHVDKPWYYYIFFGGSTDSRKRLFVDYEVAFAEGAIKNNPYYNASLGLRYRFSNRFSLSLNGSRLNDNNQVGFAGREMNGAPIGGFRDFTEFSTILSGIYNFTPRMNFTARARHYWSKVEYNRFFNVNAEGNYIDRPFVASQDFNFNVFNIDAFFTWDFRPGSRVIAGWKNWLGSDYQAIVPLATYKYYLNNFRQTFTYPHGNELSLRIIYFLDYNQLKKIKKY